MMMTGSRSVIVPAPGHEIGPAQIAQDFASGIRAGRGHDAAAGMGARAAHVETLQRPAILRVARERPGEEQLIHRELALEDVALGATDFIFQGELTMDQLLFNRPFPGYAQYRGPLKGFYMCGSGTHPGGGVMAAPGANAAREILRDLRRPNLVPGSWHDD